MDTKSTQKIYYEILSALLSKEKISVYIDDTELKHALASDHLLQIVTDPKESDIIIIGDEERYKRLLKTSPIVKKVPFFATDYHLVKILPNVIGALYWKKGRSQLIFLKQRLKYYHMDLPKVYDRYIVDSL
jgi:hypothetical protein